MLKQQINDDLNEEFLSLKKKLFDKITLDRDIDSFKQYVLNNLTGEVIFKSKILYETILNYLMKSAINEINNADIDIQNKFYASDFRNKMSEWVSTTDYKLTLNPEIVKFSSDIRITYGLAASGVIFITGSVITLTAFVPSMVIGAMISGIATIIASIYAYKKNYINSEDKYKGKVIKEVNVFLEIYQKQVHDWLLHLCDLFYDNFRKFCLENNLTISGELNGK